jgi:hypothetical protein
MTSTMKQVKATAAADKIPYRWGLIDSWWYYKGPTGGVKNWTATPEAFPPVRNPIKLSTDLPMKLSTERDSIAQGGEQGLIDLNKQLVDWPIMAHNRWWSNNTDYAIANGGAFAFSDNSAPMVVPLEQRFWDFLLGDAARRWGLAVYEQVRENSNVVFCATLYQK